MIPCARGAHSNFPTVLILHPPPPLPLHVNTVVTAMLSVHIRDWANFKQSVVAINPLPVPTFNWCRFANDHLLQSAQSKFKIGLVVTECTQDSVIKNYQRNSEGMLRQKEKLPDKLQEYEIRSERSDPRDPIREIRSKRSDPRSDCCTVDHWSC